MYKFLSRAVAASIPFIAAGCGPMHANTSSAPRAEDAVVYFSNESLDQADVYAISSSSMRTRIGTVLAGQTEALTIPEIAMGTGDVTVAARLLAHSGYIAAGPLALHGGDRYSIRLPSDVSTTLVILPAREKDIIAAERKRP